ncbi:Solute carrier family 28 member 3 [Holothuria leucospilota]|uniref:Sodium/nucleoside cotransporter n=1 Tax=Holothuria leucospilota TaxID=206669 RepID=A0A9Q1BSP7_HOLLE|nr:Solute carrier family 28 member 3 [Holothuria leucospilota]
MSSTVHGYAHGNMGYVNEDISLKSLDMSSNRNPDSEIGPRNCSGNKECQEENADSVDEDGDFQERMWRRIDESTASFTTFVKDNESTIRYGIYAILLLGYIGYLTYACYRDLEAATVLLSLTGVTLFFLIYALFRDHFGETIWKNCGSQTMQILCKIWEYGKWPISLIGVTGLAVGLYFLCRENPEQLISGTGLIFFVLFTYIFSKYPRKVKWRPVVWGLVLQFLLALFILQTNVGFAIVEWLGDVVQTFLDFSDEGAKFVFGDPQYLEHFFAFKVLPLVIYVSACISVLYYWGTMQFIIKKIAWLMERTMKTSATESLNAAGNIFLGPTDSPLMIRPMLKDMTKSEIHAVMTGGFATIAGSVLGAYIAFGISASHLLSASVMSAPAALAISKLFYPETERCAQTDELELPKGYEEQNNVIEAASHGAATAIPLALNIGGNLIAFIAILALLDGILGYLGGLVGVDELSFEFICSYVFSPIAFLMGVEWADCFIVAEMIGLKTFLNEFVAYERLAELINNRTTGAGPTISVTFSCDHVRSEVIATYALCGFSNVGAIGIQLGGLTPMAPSRASDFAEVV